jgi:hypothetical protein
MQTQFEFTLPRGFIDPSGQVHRTGIMRLSTARDEIEAYRHPQVQENEAYLPVILLSRVITRLGELEDINHQVIENLFAADLASLEDLYLRLNGHTLVTLGAVCPQCNARFQVQVAPIG